MEKIDHQTLGARLARENDSLSRLEKRSYTRMRRLEENIRRHAEGECGCRTERICLMRLYRMIPNVPRPTLRERARMAWSRSRRLNG